MIVVKIILVFCFICLIALAIMFIKNDITFKHHMRILNAICAYRMDCISNKVDALVDFSDVEDYDKTLLRVWDWSMKRILPKDKYEIIKPYIGK